MRSFAERLAPAAMALVLVLTIHGCSMPPRESVSSAASAPLVNTQWRLTQLGGEMVDNPEGGNFIGLQLQQENLRASGFAGCNRFMGSYVLDGDSLRFDQMASTRMACLDENRNRLETSYLAVFERVASWSIGGNSLVLRDAGGAPVATFAAGPAELR